MSSVDLISEVIQQPRTGIQKTSYGAKCDDSTCAYDRGTHEQASWDTKNARAQKATFGYDGYKSSVSDKCPDGQWGWQPGDGDGMYCIRPVPELCAIPAWDGYDYEPDGWAQRYWEGDSDTNPLMRTLADPPLAEPAAFINPGVSTRTQKNQGGGETTTRAYTFDMRCNYDRRKFVDLASVQAWEQRYGKYDRETEGGSATDPLRLRRRHSTGKTASLTSPAKPFSTNYERIMQNFCAQPVVADGGKDPVCMVDPLTKEPGKQCSRLKSLTPGGDACRYWLHSYGPYKWTQTNAVGELYCNDHPDSFDCRCFSRNDPRNPQYASFQEVSRAMQGSETQPACYYMPCSDPTTYIMPSGKDPVWTVPGDPNNPTANYGMQCTDNLCVNATRLDSDAQNEISQNSLYINCGTGKSPPVPPTSGTEVFFSTTYKTQPVMFWLLIISFVLAGLCVFLLFGWFAGLGAGGNAVSPPDSLPARHVTQSKPTILPLTPA